MRSYRSTLLALGLTGLLATGCQPDADVQPAEAVPGSTLPSNFPVPVYALDQNAPDRSAFELGRKLFYDPRLSRTGEVSCGSCHQQFVAFANADHRVSHGVDNRLGTRNAPALQNLRWHRALLWDGGVSNLEVLPLAPITNPVEMDETLANVLQKLNADAEYRRQFGQVYGTGGAVTSQQFLRALAQFMAALTSANARYDHYVRGEAGGTLTEAELRGLAVLRQKCASCHATDLFTDDSFRNNGLGPSFPADSGRGHITQLATDRGKFKVPSLRNVVRTAPYMHDGRFQTLAQVLDHYSGGVVASPTLDPQLRQPDGRLGIALSAQEKSDLLAFLQTLTDEDFLSNKQLAAPR